MWQEDLWMRQARAAALTRLQASSTWEATAITLKGTKERGGRAVALGKGGRLGLGCN